MKFEFSCFFFHLKNTSVLAMLALFLIMWQHYQNTCKNKMKWRENLNFICNMAAAQFHKKMCQYCHKTLVFFSMWKKNCGKIKILSATRQLSYFIRTCASIVKPLVIFWVEAKLRIFLYLFFCICQPFFQRVHRHVGTWDPWLCWWCGVVWVRVAGCSRPPSLHRQVDPCGSNYS